MLYSVHEKNDDIGSSYKDSIKIVINYFHILTHNFNLAFRFIISLCLVVVRQFVLHEYE